MNCLRNICMVKILLLVFYAQNNIGMNKEFLDQRYESAKSTSKVNKNEFTYVKISREENDLVYEKNRTCSSKGRKFMETVIMELEEILKGLRGTLNNHEKERLRKFSKLLERLKKIKSDDDIKKGLSYLYEKSKKNLHSAESLFKKYLLDLPESILDQVIFSHFVAFYYYNYEAFNDYQIRCNCSNISKLHEGELLRDLFAFYYTALTGSALFYFEHADEHEKLEQYSQFDKELKILFQF